MLHLWPGYSIYCLLISKMTSAAVGRRTGRSSAVGRPAQRRVTGSTRDDLSRTSTCGQSCRATLRRHALAMGRRADVPPKLLTTPFSVARAEAMGVSAATLRGPRFRAPFRGVRVAATLEDTLRLRAAAALVALPDGAALSCHTAAGLRQLPVPTVSSVHADIPTRSVRARIDGIVAHRRDVPVVVVQGLPVCAPVPMFVELAQHLALVDLVVVGDALVRRGWLELDALRAGVTVVVGRRRVGLAARAADLVRPRVDSPLETKVRLLLVLAGLPSPVSGFEVVHDGQFVAVVDLAYPQWRVIIEYDGDLHRTRKSKWRMDVATREALRDLGWTVIVLTWDDIAATPARTVGRVARELTRRGCPDVPPAWRAGTVDPRSLGADWHTAFQGSARAAWDWSDVPPA